MTPLCQSPLKMPGRLALCLLIAITLSLYLTGVRWGLPNDAPWNTDSIAGIKTVRMIPSLFRSWCMRDEKGNPYQDREGKPVIERYPRAQFLITGTLYKPFLESWKKNPVQVKHPRTGQTVNTDLNRERISHLILVSRIVTLLMAVGAVLGVFATVRLLTRDSLAGFLAALVLAFSPVYTYLAHLGNLDVPVTFWFIWSAFWTVKALQTGSYRYFILLGLFAGIVVTTKDPSAGHLGGLALFVIVAMAVAQFRKERLVLKMFTVFANGRLWLTLACFLFVFALMNSVWDFEAFQARMVHWLSVKKDYVSSMGSQWRLFTNAVFCIRECCGLWMFGLIGLSLLYCIWRYPLMALWAVAPFIIFHLAVTMGAAQVQPRYHLPSLACLAIVVGLAGRDLLKLKALPIALRCLPLVVIIGLEAIFAVAVSAEMTAESRIRAENWIRENLDKQKDTITFISPPSYMPRSLHEGYRVKYTHNVKMTTADSIRHQPQYLALSAKWFRDPLHFDQEFRKKLLKEKMDYRKIIEFGPRFLPPGARGLFKIATCQTRPRDILSPKIIIMEQVASGSAPSP